MRRRHRAGFRGWKDVQECVRDELGSYPENFCLFVEALQEEAYEIASHLEENWQDHRAAKAWRRLGRWLDGVRASCEDKLPLPPGRGDE